MPGFFKYMGRNSGCNKCSPHVCCDCPPMPIDDRCWAWSIAYLAISGVEMCEGYEAYNPNGVWALELFGGVDASGCSFAFENSLFYLFIYYNNYVDGTVSVHVREIDTDAEIFVRTSHPCIERVILNSADGCESGTAYARGGQATLTIEY